MGHPAGLFGRRRRRRGMPRSGHRPPPGQLWRAGTVAGHAQRPGGLLGGLLTVLRERCPAFSDSAVRSLTLVGQPAYGQPLKPAGCLWLKAGPTCLPGSAWCRGPAQLTDLTGSPSRVLCVAHTEPFLPRAAAFLAAIPPCALALPAIPRPVRMPLHGSKPSQATPTPCSPLRQCRSRCVAGSGSNSRSHLVAVEPAILMLLRALELASWPGGPNLWSGPGARWRGTWCPNHGSSTPLRQASRPTTAGASTSSFTGGALCCDPTLVSPLTRDGEPHPGAAAQDGAVPPTLSSRQVARKRFACSAAK